MENDVVEIDLGQELGERQTRRVYLITYSQADLDIIANCQAFADCILEAFSQGNPNDNKSHPEHWSCCMENHKDGYQTKCTKAVESRQKLRKHKTRNYLAFL